MTKHCAHAIALSVLLASTTGAGWTLDNGAPRAALIPAPARTVITIPAEVDSNSPMVWDRVDGTPTLFALASWGGQPVLLHGSQLDRLEADGPITMSRHPGNGI